MSASSLLAIPTLAAVASAQFTGYPTTMYGQAWQPGQQWQSGQWYTGAYGNYGRQCRSNVRSEDLPGGFQNCYCDKNHRDEDYCYDNEGVAAGDYTYAECKKDAELKWGKTYYDDIFDEDCVAQPTDRNGRNVNGNNVRRCQAKTRSKDVAGQAVCWCDSNHKKDTDDLDDELAICEDSFSEDELIANHYTVSASYWSSQLECPTNTANLKSAFEEYDPNCVERFGGYGSYGPYGSQQNYNMGFGAGYGSQQNFGGFNMGFGAGYGSQQNFGGFNMGFGAGYPTQYTGGYGARYMGDRYMGGR